MSGLACRPPLTFATSARLNGDVGGFALASQGPADDWIGAGGNMGLGVAIGAYVLVAVLAMIPTCLEQSANGTRGVLRRLPGLVACLLWPLPVAAVVILALRQRRRNGAACD